MTPLVRWASIGRISDRNSTRAPRTLVAALGIALVIAPAVPMLLLYNEPFGTCYKEDPSEFIQVKLGFLASPGVAALLTLIAFDLRPPRRLRGSRWRFALSVPVALAAFLIVVLFWALVVLLVWLLGGEPLLRYCGD